MVVMGAKSRVKCEIATQTHPIISRKALLSAHDRGQGRGLTGRVEGLLIMGCSLRTSSTANVEVTLGIAGIDLWKILRSMSLVASSSV